MARYPGNHIDSELLNVPRRLKTRPGAPETHLAYITDDEADLLKEYKPGTPHEGAAGIPNYDTWGIDSSGNVTGGSTAGGGGGWSGDPGGGQNQGGGQQQQSAQEEQRKRAEHQRYLDDLNRQHAAEQSKKEAAKIAAVKQSNIDRIKKLEQVKHANQMKEMADSMAAAGQISGGLSGGTYTKGPVAYPKHWYTPEGWAEVQQRGWSSKLLPEFQHTGEWSITDDEADQYGKLQDLPEGVIYSTAIGDPERGYGGYKRVSNFTDGGSGPGGWSGWPGGRDGSGGGGYGGYGPAGGPTPQQMANYYTPQANLQQAMINVHKSPTVFKKRGGIVSLLRLS